MKGRDILKSMVSAGHPVGETQAVPPTQKPAGAVRAMNLSLGRLNDEANAARELRDALAAGDRVVELDPASVESSFIQDRIPVENDREFEKLTAGGWRKQGFHGAMHKFPVKPQKEHAITEGISEFTHGRDELYQNSLLTPGSEVLVTAWSDKTKDPKNTGKDEPMVWINKYGDGRVVQNALGHDVEAMQSPGFQILLVRCVEWAATGETWTKAPEELSAVGWWSLAELESEPNCAPWVPPLVADAEQLLAAR